MNLKKIIKNSSNFFLKHLKSITVLFSFVIILIIGFFLYFNFYQTIISAKQIIILQTDIAPSTVDIKLLNDVEKKYENKLKPTVFSWEKFSNIFSTNINLQNPSPVNSTLNNVNPQINF